MCKHADRLLRSLPKALRIGAQTYAVKLVDFPPEKRVWGEFDSDLHIISLSRTMPTPGRAIETVLHEVLHAMWASRQLPGEVREEAAVEQLAPAIMCLFNDNPRFRAWLWGATK
jgi:hypothetical protein